MELNLTAVQCRVLGSVMEKELTVPATYPMTLKAVTTACNQTSGRDPIMELAEAEVSTALDELRTLGLLRLVHPSHGARSVKYRQVASEELRLESAERAVLTLLMLRGPQTPGELRSRSERLHGFTSVDEVLAALEELAAGPEPLAHELGRRPGQKESRWAHLAGESAATEAGDPVVNPVKAGPGTEASGAPGGAAVVPATPAAGPEHAPLAALVGRWIGEGQGSYPTIQSFTYTEEITFAPVPGKPLLSYRSRTRGADGRGLHAEDGWFRMIAPGEVEIVIAQAPGIVEVAEGIVEARSATAGADGPGVEVIVSSTLVAGTSTSVEVKATERRYVVDGSSLTYDLAMAAVGLPMTHHLRAALHRA